MHAIQFRPVTESPWYESRPPWPWPIADLPPFCHFPLNGEMDDAEVGSMVAALCNPLEQESLRGSPIAVLEALEGLDCFGLRGGLQIVSSGEVCVRPGCCSGLESWRELYEMLEGQSPWMGHGPDAWCEFPDDQTIRFWHGGMGRQRIGPSVDIPRHEAPTLLEGFHRDLTAAMERLRDWLRSIRFPRSRALVDKFGRSLAITTESPLYESFG